MNACNDRNLPCLVIVANLSASFMMSNEKTIMIIILPHIGPIGIAIIATMTEKTIL